MFLHFYHQYGCHFKTAWKSPHSTHKTWYPSLERTPMHPSPFFLWKRSSKLITQPENYSLRNPHLSGPLITLSLPATLLRRFESSCQWRMQKQLMVVLIPTFYIPCSKSDMVTVLYMSIPIPIWCQNVLHYRVIGKLEGEDGQMHAINITYHIHQLQNLAPEMLHPL